MEQQQEDAWVRRVIDGLSSEERKILVDRSVKLVGTITDEIVRARLMSLFSDRYFLTEELATVVPGTIVHGSGARTLKESASTFESLTGVRIAAASYDGRTKRQRNEDRAVVCPSLDVLAVVDGMGGKPNGEEAAQCIADAIVAYPFNPQLVEVVATTRMRAKDLSKGCGACASIVRIAMNEQGDRSLELSTAGDIAVWIFENDSLKAVSSGKDFKPPPLIMPLPHNPFAHMVDSYIGQEGSFFIPRTPQPLAPGSRALLCSDGLYRNFRPYEVEKMIRGKSPEEAIHILSDAYDERITEQIHYDPILARYNDRFHQPPGVDNVSVIIADIPA